MLLFAAKFFHPFRVISDIFNSIYSISYILLINNISLIVESLLEYGETLSTAERRELFNDLVTQAERSSEIVKNLLELKG